jgi:ABC-type iron transport system FetAB permease component
MNTSNRLSRFLLIAGYIAMLIGAIDPMEGSLLILPGSALVAMGTFLSSQQRGVIIYRLWSFFLIIIGVAALWVTTMLGGIGGDSEYSMWWALFFLPYPIGWSMGIWGPDSPRWVLWSGIVVGIWYVVMMFLVIKMSHRWTETSMEGVIIGGLIAAIGLVTIAGCIYRLRKPKAA